MEGTDIKMSKVLSVNNIYKSYGNTQVLKNVSFEMEKGDIVGLIGQNGAGKTTLIDILAGVIAPNSGSVLLCDKWSVNDCENYYKNLCVAFDQSPFYPHLTGYKNLRIYSADEKKINTYLKFFGLEEVKNKKVSTYSLGMKQRLNISRAFLMWSNLMIMDEPINGLDTRIVIQVKKYIQEKSKEGFSALISCHALKEMLLFCNRFIFVHKGQIVVEIDSKSGDFETYDTYGDLDDNSLQEWLATNKVAFLKIPLLNKVYFKNENNIPHFIKASKIESGTNILENLYLQIENID